mmetsp:Transcript_12449/g.40743  ORF Transcript_12449/g.40743 Transcript_12449/m.40743 type:complete len:543 (+) Transcript_12449:202-1830(+)
MALWPLWLSSLCVGAAAPSVSVTVRNVVGRDVQISWVAPGSGKKVPQTAKPTKHGSSTGINSFEGHEFVVEDATAGADERDECGFWAKVGECATNPGYMLKSCARSCRQNSTSASASFVVGATEEYITVGDDWQVTRTGPAKRARERAAALWADCETTTGAESESSSSSSSSSCRGDAAACARGRAELEFLGPLATEMELEKAIFQRAFAVKPRVTPSEDHTGALTTAEDDVDETWRLYEAAKLKATIGEGACVDEETCLAAVEAAGVAFYRGTDSLRRATRRRAAAVRNATCASSATETTFLPEAVVVDDADFEWEGRRASDLFYRPDLDPSARVARVSSFVSEEECDAMVSFARPRLRKATHAKDGDLGAVSETRDAQQATVDARSVPAADDVRRRAVRLANFLSNYSLAVDGQEDLMAIQYHAGQQYMLHCDGSCDGTPFLPGGRLATLLMFCKDADDGGATTFPNAGAHVIPRAGDAVYFHFRAGGGPKDGLLTEHWHTEHSGCEVRAGEKWVITFWLRDGVDNDTPAYRFSPFGGPL